MNVPTATSRSVQLKNMFNPAEETERDWDIELRDDVKSECEAKYGPVVEIYVLKESAVGVTKTRTPLFVSSVRALMQLSHLFLPPLDPGRDFCPI